MAFVGLPLTRPQTASAQNRQAARVTQCSKDWTKTAPILASSSNNPALMTGCIQHDRSYLEGSPVVRQRRLLKTRRRRVA